ncbi:CoA transferase [Burkholderia pseudomallei]|uniref:CaiB/BaiF CoA transferase family protein n=1 Tax=Burkholderia pseudomallei TaxID=28450 RepID=UPI001A9DCF61|nr:CaiB/BaiF CoA-transferase family protein [Burkholderia pseudomallei]MBO7776755.1 CoA transferase [Burkholderia pseudomallei]MBO7909650.1 CoA transferase [Burkholderia pseudomallei]QTB53382.1 CoA transferase [Burkholderia pseudomallei]
MPPLEGVTVIALEHAIAAPFCTRQLADLGARVIKVERPHVGDFAREYDERVLGMSSSFVWANRSKESVTLDLKQLSAREALMRLLARADVFIQNLAPGAADRLGLDYDSLSTDFPTLIVCGISGYGPDGPYRDKKAYDLLIQSEAGLLSITGTPDSPAKAGCSIADIATGMYAYTNILSALLKRQRTGSGCRIDISMLESMVEWMGFPMYYSIDGQSPPLRSGASHATIFPYGPFATGDGKTVMLGLQNEREWKTFCSDVLRLPLLADDPRFASNPQRIARREDLGALIRKIFGALTSEELTCRLNAVGIANAHLNDMQDVWAHPQLAARNRWTTVLTEKGLVPVLLPPGADASKPPELRAVPALGEHTESILEELGFTDEQIQEMHVTDAI